MNFELLSCGCYAELSAQNPLSLQAALHLEDLASIPCILLASRTQQNTEQAYFQDTLGFSGRFLFAETLGEARLMVAGNRGFLPLESIGTLPAPETSVRRLPICVGDRQLKRNYCLFWSREHSSAYPEAFAAILRGLLPTP